MDAPWKPGRGVDSFIEKEVSSLKKIAGSMAMSAQEREWIGRWLELLRTSPFGRYLLLNRRLDGRWVGFLDDSRSVSWFEGIAVLAAVRSRHETFKSVLEKKLSPESMVAVYPLLGVEEWVSFQRQRKGEWIGVQSAPELVANEGAFDIFLWNSFVYGDLAEDLINYIFSSLKPGGILLTSVWSPLPQPTGQELQEDLFFEKLLEMKKSPSPALSDFKEYLRHVGFSSVQVIGNKVDGLSCLIAKKAEGDAGKLQTKRFIMHVPRRGARRTCSLK